ncbi:MAG: CopG family ribbon-helix-helix protein [Desulfurococcaceae archaeon]
MAGAEEERRRFGVSISRDLSLELDRIASERNVSRSRIVEEAIAEYISNEKHERGEEHVCEGIAICCTRGRCSAGKIEYEKYREIIVSSAHYHLEDLCIETFIVKGPYKDVWSLVKSLRAVHSYAKYVPMD